MPFENLGSATLISDFTGTDENPLSEGGNWAELDLADNPLQRLSNAAAGSVAAAANRSYWTPANFGPDLEAYATIGAVTATMGICARVQGEGGTSTWDGYEVASGVGVTSIFRATNGGVGTLMTISTTWTAGDKLGARFVGNQIQAYQQLLASSDWTLILSATDSTYGSAGKIGLRTQTTASNWGDFYAASGGSAAVPLVTA